MPFASKRCVCRGQPSVVINIWILSIITAKGNPSDAQHIKNVMGILNAANKLCSLTGTQRKVFITFNITAKQKRLIINHLCKPFRHTSIQELPHINTDGKMLISALGSRGEPTTQWFL